MSSFYNQKPWLKSYPSWLPAELPAAEDTILDRFLMAASADPSAPCIHYFDTTFSYGQIEKMARSFATALHSHRVTAGDRVILVMQNIPQAIIAKLAVWFCNGVVVPLNPMYTGNELVHYLDDSRAQLVICQDDLYPDRVSKAVAGRDTITVITTSSIDLFPTEDQIPHQLAKTQKIKSEKTRDFLEALQLPAYKPEKQQLPKPRDLAYLVYTSGTTGPAKGTLIRHANVVYNSSVYAAACRMGKGDVVHGVAPLFHITGIVAHIGISFYLGIPLLLFGRFDAGTFLHMAEKYRASFTVAAITVYIAVLNHPQANKFDLSAFDKAYSGGAPISPSTLNKFRDEMNLELYNVYGLTESSSPATITPLGAQLPVDQESGALAVGLVIPGHEAWIVDVDDPNQEVPPGQEGELVLRGPGITDGYWEKPEETAHAIKDGRFFTGDIAKIDEAGWIYIVDRKKDLINASGYKIWPRDVEDVLYQHSAVKEAAVVGVPDEYRGETVKAFVSLREGFQGKIKPEDLIAFCKERMAAFKYPRIVDIIDEVPKSATGKFLRRKLRDKNR